MPGWISSEEYGCNGSFAVIHHKIRLAVRKVEEVTGKTRPWLFKPIFTSYTEYAVK